MTLSDIFGTISTLFAQLQLWTGLSAPALLWLLFTTYKALMSAGDNTDTMMEYVSYVAIRILFWWLIGYLIINPIWNILIGRL